MKMFFPKKKKQEITLNLARIPKHIAIDINGTTKWAEKKNLALKEAFIKSFLIIEDLMGMQTKLKIPIMTFFVLPETTPKSHQFSNILDTIVQFFDSTQFSELINSKKIKVTILGKWYNLPGKIVDRIKSLIEETKDYDSFFLNFCINYNGQEELVDACRLIGRQIESKKLSVDSISKELIKENIYSSYFIPPNLVIRNGSRKTPSSFLLWDSIHSQLYFSDKPFPEFTKSDLLKAIKEYQKK